jgi:D-xylose transport system substrate-binding protein
VSTPLHRFAALGAALIVGTGGLAACGANDSNSTSGDSSSSDKTIALLLPESKTTRYEAFDKPLFEAKVKELCSDCTVDYYNADQDEAKQQQQVETAISQGAKVVVLDPVNGAGAGGMVQSAQDSGAKVIAYDRFIEGVDYYMSFDNETVGKMQAEALADAVGGKGNILMLNGAPSDPNAAQFKAGAHSVLDSSDVKILEEYDNPDWSPENAQQWTTDQLGKYPPSDIQGVYAANDGQAGGVVAALTGAGVAEDALPPITGQDAELAAIQRILAGEQYMTVYKPIKPLADNAATLAVAVVNGEDPASSEVINGEEDNGTEQVPAAITDTIPVFADNVNDTVVKDGYWTAQDICTKEYEQACKDAGIE